MVSIAGTGGLTQAGRKPVEVERYLGVINGFRDAGRGVGETG